MKIKKLTVRPESGIPTHGYIDSKYHFSGRSNGYELDSLPVGHAIDLNGDPLVLLIGDNGTGKTTFAARLAVQGSFKDSYEDARDWMARSDYHVHNRDVNYISPFDSPDSEDLERARQNFRPTQFYDIETTEGEISPTDIDVRYVSRAESQDQEEIVKDSSSEYCSPEIVRLKNKTSQVAHENAERAHKEKNTIGIWENPYETAANRPSSVDYVLAYDDAKTAPGVNEGWQKLDQIKKQSTGQFQLGQLEKYLARFNNGEVVILDQPEDGVSMRNRRKLAQRLRKDCINNPNKQRIVITHDQEICKIPEARVVCFDYSPAKVFAPGEFDVEAYLSFQNTELKGGDKDE